MSIENTEKELSPLIKIQDLSKSYGSLCVLTHYELVLSPDQIYCLMGASGRGKTTLLRIILGLEQPDAGTITTTSDLLFSAVFQEDRLCEAFSALENVSMAAAPEYTQNQLIQELCQLLPEESISRPVYTLSGGMKRRVAIARALLAPSQAVLMDEPFTGLDEGTKQVVIDYILKKRGHRLLLITTHQEEDVALLSAKRIMI